MNSAFRILAIVMLGILAGCGGKSKTNTHPKMNVLFIVVDDLTSTTLGCYGHPVVKTPNIDKLAKQGIKFTGAYCNFAVCGPSRGSFLTGLRPETIGITDNRTPLQGVLGDRITLPNLFKQNGYHTMGLGKIFHGHDFDGHGEGHGDSKAWHEYYDFEATEIGKQGEMRNVTNGKLPWCHWQAAEGDDADQSDGQITNKAIDLLKAKRDKPFFLAVGLRKPHDPFIAPKKYFEQYPLDICAPPFLPDNWTPAYKHSLPGETVTFNKFTDTDKREFMRSYYACTSFMDAQVGKLLKALEETGQIENTLVVFFGDHGYHVGEHNWWNKVTIYEKGTNAPFIMSGPLVKQKGATSNSLFEFIDIYPTLIDICDLDNTPIYLEGSSFAKLLKAPELTFREEVYATTRRGKMIGKMVKNKAYRYILWDDGKNGHELYDQKDDPVEYQNLAEDAAYTTVVEEMKQLIINHY